MAHAFDLRPAKAAGLLGQPARGNPRRQRPVAQVDLEDLLAGGLLRQGKLNLEVESSRPQQGRVQQIAAVRGRQHQAPLEFLDPVHLGQQLTEHAAAHARVLVAAAGSG